MSIKATVISNYWLQKKIQTVIKKILVKVFVFFINIKIKEIKLIKNNIDINFIP